MTPHSAGSERLYRQLLRVYPRAFRARFADDMAQLFGDQLRDARAAGRTAAGIWLRGVGDIAVSATAEHVRRDRSMAHSLAAPPSTVNRALGLSGVLGGAILLAAFAIDFSPELNVVRLIGFNVGAIAIVVAVHRRQAPAAPRLSLLAAIPALLANVWNLAMILLSIGHPQPTAGDFGLVSFYASVAMWLADAAFAIVTFRIGAVSRWGASALAVGSLLALIGIDRFGLVSAGSSTIWAPIALTGIALNGIGWILLGLHVALARPASPEGGAGIRLRE